MKVGNILVENLSLSFNDAKNNLLVLKDISFDIKSGEFTTFLGISGCGKTTLLYVLAGFLKPDIGNVFIDNYLIKKHNPDRGMVFQNYTLFPWLTTYQNVSFGLKMKGISKEERHAITTKYIKLVGLEEFENTYPIKLSGGMQQRVGLARALATDPDVLLMDEPFGSLDFETRISMQELLLDIWEKHKKTVVFVTHDIDEAILLSDKIIVMTARPGQIKEKIEIKLNRPRKYEVVLTKEFIVIKQYLLSLIREESRNFI